MGLGIGNCCCGGSSCPSDCCVPSSLRIWVASSANTLTCYFCDECPTTPHQLILSSVSCPIDPCEFLLFEDVDCPGDFWPSGGTDVDPDPISCLTVSINCVQGCWEVSYTQTCVGCEKDPDPILCDVPGVDNFSNYYEHTWRAIMGQITFDGVSYDCALLLIHFIKRFSSNTTSDCSDATAYGIYKEAYQLINLGSGTGCCGDFFDLEYYPIYGFRFCPDAVIGAEQICMESIALAEPGHPEYAQLEVVC